MIGRILTAWFRGLERRWCSASWQAAKAPVTTAEVLALAPQDRYHAKQGRSTGRWTFGASGQVVSTFIKRHHALPWLARLAAILWPSGGWSPAWREYRQLTWAKRNGVTVPEPLAVGEQIGPGLRLRSYLAVAELVGMIPLHEAVGLAAQTLSPDSFLRWKRSCIREAARMVRRLHDCHRYHKDLYLCHFFVSLPTEEKHEIQPGQLVLIDLHRMAEHRLLGGYFRVKDLAQLLYSTADLAEINDRDRLRFLWAYGGGKISRWLLWTVRAKGMRYLRHNRKRKPGHFGPLPGEEAIRGGRVARSAASRVKEATSA